MITENPSLLLFIHTLILYLFIEQKIFLAPFDSKTEKKKKANLTFVFWHYLSVISGVNVQSLPKSLSSLISTTYYLLALFRAV